MIRYILQVELLDNNGNYYLYPALNPQSIESQNAIDRKNNYNKTFMADETSFKGMFPAYIGEGGFPKIPHVICDMHNWIVRKPYGFMYPISARFKEILEKFNIPNLKFYPGSVIWKDIEYPYYVFHLLIRQFDYIDFSKSTFIQGNIDGQKDGELIVNGNNMDEVTDKLDSPIWIFEKAIMKPEFETIDMTHLGVIGIVISERLKNAIEEANLTGVKITTCPIEFHLSNKV
ncbi:MAG: hypothetical protein RLZZ175_923 [Bacteroidota bacterium]|jgi:hypothetical protein